MRKTRTVCLLAAAPVVLAAAVFAAGEIYRRGDFSEFFASMHEGLIEASESDSVNGAGRRIVSVELRDAGGIKTEAFLLPPAGGGAKSPAVIVLGGLRTGRRTVEYLGKVHGIAVLAMDYPYDGKREGLGTFEFVRSLPRIRRAVLRTPPAVMLAVDYLTGRDDIDGDRITLVGGSFGALFVPAAAAADGRIDAAAMLFGGCDIEALVAHGLGGPEWLGAVAGWAASVLLAPVEPSRWIGEISPRPVFLLSAVEDELIPAACSRKLHQEAGEPSTTRWIETGHLDIRSERFHETVVRMLVEWMGSRGLIPVPGRDFRAPPRTGSNPSPL